MSDSSTTTLPPPPAPLAKWTQLLVVCATFLLLIALVAVLVRLGMAISHTLLLFALGGLVAYGLDPLVEWLRYPFPQTEGTPRRGLTRPASVTLVFILLLVLVGSSLWWISGRLVEEVTILQRDYPTYQQRAMDLAAQADTNLLSHGIHFSITDTLKNPPDAVRTTVAHFGEQAVPVLRNVAAILAESIIVLLISLYFLLYGAGMKREFNEHLPQHLREYVEAWQTDVSRILGGFVRGQLAIALITGAAAAVVCFSIGLHLWLLLGIIVVFAALIPVFGPYIGALPAIIAAMIGPTHIHNPVGAALVVGGLFFVINEAASKVLYPRLVGKALGLHEVLVLFVLFAGLEIGGIVGTLFAAPATALIFVTVVHLYRYWLDLPDNLLSGTARKAPASETVV